MKMTQMAIATLFVLLYGFQSVFAQATADQDQGAEIVMPWVFADHMVVQRDVPIPVWGQSAPHTSVEVCLDGQTVRTVCDAAGQWRIDLTPRAATLEPLQLSVKSGGRELRFNDVLVGEVWLCAGQSNMDFELRRADEGAEAAEKLGGLGTVRLCNRTGSPSGSARPLGAEELGRMTPKHYFTGSWQTASTARAMEFSAVGAFFGLQLHEELHVPIGLIDVSVGGSSTEGWLPIERLKSDPELAPLAGNYLQSALTHPFIRERTRLQLGDSYSANQGEPLPPHFFAPGFLYEAGVVPLAPFAVRGVLWYQGESNAHQPRIADKLFRMMTQAWRSAWAQPDMLFCFVQLPGMGRETWPAFREMQEGWLDDPNTEMAVAIDLGHPTDVHPRKKRELGDRLARLVLKRVHGKEIHAYGPRFASAQVNGSTIEVSFAHAEGLRWSASGPPQGFEIAGPDRCFYSAQAEIVGSTVRLRSSEVEQAQDVRYAWAPFQQGSLVNAAQLPAAPFRTQEWRALRIACIGDSITAGFGLEQPSVESYPARLQQLLGDGFDVRNFGRSGACVGLDNMRGTLPRAYRRNMEHQEALLFEPNVVVSNLGVNDIMDWSVGAESFVEDYSVLIEDYRRLDTRPLIAIWSPLAPLFSGHRYFSDPYLDEINRAIARVAESASVARIDLASPLNGHAEWFPDAIHPNGQGAQAIAAAVLAGLVQLNVK